MTKKEKGTAIGFLIIIGCVTYSRGIGAGWNVIKTLFSSAFEWIKALCALALQFPSELGITDWLMVKGIYLIVAAGAGAAGVVLSQHEKGRILGIISILVSAGSLIGIFIP